MYQEATLVNPLSPNQSVWKKTFWWFQAVVTCTLVFALCRMCHWDRMASIWISGDPLLWLTCVVFLNVCLLAGGLALLVLIRPDGREFSRRRFLLDYVHVQSLSQLTPGQIGEALLPFMQGCATIPPGTVAAGLLLQRIVAVVIVAAATVCFASSWIAPGYVLAQIGVVLLGCIAIMYLIGHDDARARFNAVVGRRYGPILNGFHTSWVKMLQENRWRQLVPHICLMIFRFVTMILASYVVYRSFGISIPLLPLTGILAMSMLATLVPVSLNGLGIVEAVLVLSLQRYGVSSEEVLSVCLMGRSLWMLVLLCWSLLFWMLAWSEHRASHSAG